MEKNELTQLFGEQKVARKGGKIAGDAKKKLESQIGRSVITREKASDYLPPADRIKELREETED